MIEKLIEYSIKNKFVVLIITVILTIFSIYAIKTTSLDALPDLSPPQVIVQIKWQGQSPQIIENQVSFPIISALMSLPNIDTVRAMSSFQNALIYVIFEDNTNLYDARNRILEQLSTLSSSLPKGAKVTMGPDATGVGWAYQYALKSKTKSLDELRSLQDYYYKYALLGVDGVSEVASIGGFVKNYEVLIDEDKLIKYNLTYKDIVNKIRMNNNDKGGGVILENGYENIIQARGYLKNTNDISKITLKTINNTPIKIENIGHVNITSKSRRGLAGLNGEGEVVGGIVIVRFGENTYDVIQRVKNKLKTLQVNDVEIIEVYDRSSLINKAISTLKSTLLEESLVVLIVSVLFLFHLRSAFIIIIILPITVAITFLFMKLFGVGSNIMSLGGIAIAIGAMVDASIVMVENAHKYIHKLQDSGEIITNKKRIEIILTSSKQVGRPIFFALLLVVVSFFPIFALTGQEGRLFTPLAYTKTFAMMVGAILSISVVPILMVFLLKGKLINESKNPINRFFQILYLPLLKLSLKLKYIFIILSIVFLAFSYKIYKELNWEFMPMINEQVFMYMPVTPYGISVDLAKELMQKTNRVIKSFPEVKNVFGKVGRADTATDPAPLAMIESIITFKDKSEWRTGVSYKSIMSEMESKLQLPGLINSWTYPIRGRIDMLLTGIRTPLGIKLYGQDKTILATISNEIEQKLKTFKGTLSVSSDKANGGYFLNVDIDQEKISRYGISKNDILDVISYGVGGAKISSMIKGVERYPITLRVDSTNRDINSIKNLKIKTKLGYFPISSFATIKREVSSSVLKSEKALGVSFIYITPKQNISAKQYKEKAIKVLKDVKLPNGYFYEWAGESEYLQSAMDKLQYIIPVTLAIIFLLIYFALNNIYHTITIFLSLPFALGGGVIYLWYLDFNMSLAVVVGFMALLGVAAETSIVMMVYLKEAYIEAKGNISLKEIIYDGAVQRLRPKLMTVFAILGGLIPIMFITGVGSEVMQRIAAPMIGGMISSTVLTLFIIPIAFFMIHKK